MKRVILIMATAFALSACGGGGGGAAAPSVNLDSPPPEETRRLTPAEQAELRTAADALLNDLDGLENNAEADSLRQEIDALLADIDNFRLTITELQNEIANLRSEIDTLKEKPPSPPDETMTPPPDETTTPPDETMTPPDETMTPPPDETTTPPDVITIPPDETTTPPGENDNPQMDMTTPIETRPIDEFDSLEFRRNPVLSLANPLPAYERGFFGQGVTVMLSDNGFLNTHEDLAGQFDENDISLSAQENRFADAQHGTNSAGILAARRNGIGMHGIAPSVIIVPVDSALYPNARWKHAVSVGIPIISESLGAGVEHFLVTAEFSAITATSSVYNRATAFAADVGESDVQLVRSNGNGGTHTKENLRPGDITAYFPFIDRNLEDNVLVVMALTTLNMPDDSTNGCGVAAEWCIGAVGDYHYTTDNNIPYRNLGIRGNTSAAAPVVSGALALLKSFRPELKMTVIRQVLLESARPLGTRKNDGMPDEVFGWGAVDVGNGIATLQAMQTANGMAYSDLRKSLPSEFSHLRGRMESVSVAIRITDRSFYNMRLSDIVGGGDSQKTSLGNVAKEMQADDSLSPENAGFGFNYANGDYDLHYAGGNENAFRFSGGLRHDDSRSSYIGEGGGIFSAENASDTGGYVKWTTKNYGGISAFGEYGRTQIKADYDSASFISQIKNARAEEWTAGFQYQNLFLHNDSLQFSARQESRISGGEMVLHYPVADGDSHKAFIGESVQTIRTETARIPIKQKPQTIYTAGYSQKTENSKWSAAAEWNTATNAKGVSFAIELQIR